MSQPVALLDCDGPLLDFVGAVCKRAEELRRAHPRGTTMPIVEPRHITSWDVFGFLPGVHQEMVKRHCDSPTFWEGLSVVPGAQAGVEALRKAGFRVVVLTAPWVLCKSWEHVRRYRLQHTFDIPPKDVIVTDAKDLVCGKVFIDDKPSHVKAWGARFGRGAHLFEMPHNASEGELYPQRFTWDRVGDLIDRHAKSP